MAIIAFIRVTKIDNKKNGVPKTDAYKVFMLDHCLGKLHGAEALGLERGTTSPYL